MGKTSLKQTDEEVAGAARAGRRLAAAALRDFLLRGGRLTKVAGEVASYAASVGRSAPSALAGAAAIILGAGFGGAALTALTAGQALAACSEDGAGVIYCTGATSGNNVSVRTSNNIVLGTNASLIFTGSSASPAINMTATSSAYTEPQTLTQSGTGEIRAGGIAIRHSTDQDYGGVTIDVKGPVVSQHSDGIFVRKGRYGSAVVISAGNVTGQWNGIKVQVSSRNSKNHSGALWTSITSTGTVTASNNGIYVRSTTGHADTAGITVTAKNASGTSGSGKGIYIWSGNNAGPTNDKSTRYIGSVSVTVTGTVTGGSGAAGSAIKVRSASVNKYVKIDVASGATVGTGGGGHALHLREGRLKATVNSGATVHGKVLTYSGGRDEITFKPHSTGTLTTVDGVEVLTIESRATVKVGGSGTSVNKLTLESGGTLDIAHGGVIGSFTVGGGNFAGGGTITLGADFSGSTPNADKLYFNGDLSGTTTLDISSTGSGATGEFLVVHVGPLDPSNNFIVDANSFVAGSGYSLRYDSNSKKFYAQVGQVSTASCSTGRNVSCTASGVTGVIREQVERTAGRGAHSLVVTLESGVSAEIPAAAAAGSRDAFKLNTTGSADAGEIRFTQAAGGGGITGQEHGINVTDAQNGKVEITVTGTVVGRTKAGIYVKRNRAQNRDVMITAASVSGGESGIHVIKNPIGRIRVGTFLNVDPNKGILRIVATGLVTSSGNAASGHAGIRVQGDILVVGTFLASEKDHPVTVSAATVTSEAHGIWVRNEGTVNVTATGSVTVTGTGTGNAAGTGIHVKDEGEDHVSTVKVTAGTGTGASFSGTVVSGRKHGIFVNLDEGKDNTGGHDVTISAGSVSGLGGHGIYARLNERGAVSVRSTGSVTGSGANSDGVSVRHLGDDSSPAASVSVFAGDVTGKRHGIYIDNRPSKNVIVSVAGSVSGGSAANEHAIFAKQEDLGTANGNAVQISLLSGALVNGETGSGTAIRVEKSHLPTVTVNSGAELRGKLDFTGSTQAQIKLDGGTFNAHSMTVLTGANDLLELSGASVTIADDASISGGAGSDTVRFTGGASEIVNEGNGFVDFETVDIQSGATAKLGSAGSISGATTVAGTLSLVDGETSSLTLDGTFTGGGTIALDVDFSEATPSADTLYINGNVTGTTTINVSSIGAATGSEFLVIDVDPAGTGNFTVTESSFAIDSSLLLRYESSTQQFFAKFRPCSAGRDVTCIAEADTKTIQRAAGYGNQPLQIQLRSGFSVNIPANAPTGAKNAFSLTTSGGTITLTQDANGGDIVGQDHGIHLASNNLGAVNITTTGKVVGRTKSGIYAKRTTSSYAGIRITAASVTGGESGIHVENSWIDNARGGPVQIVATGQVTSSGSASTGHAGIRVDSDNRGAGAADDVPVTVSAASVTSEAHGIWVRNDASVDVTATGSVTVIGTGTGNDAGTGIHVEGGQDNRASSVKVVAGTGTGSSFAGSEVSGRRHGISAALIGGLATNSAHNLTVSAGSVIGLGGHGIYAKLDQIGVANITATGVVTGSGTDSDGVSVKHEFEGAGTVPGTTVSVDVGGAVGNRHGIYVYNKPSKDISVSVSGAVSGGTGANEHAIFAKQKTLGTASGNAVQIRLLSGARVNGGTESNSAAAIRVEKSHLPTVTIGNGAELRGKLDFTGSTEAEVKIDGGTFNAHGTTALTGGDDVFELSGANLTIADDASISGGAGSDTVRFTGGASKIVNEGDGLTGFESVEISTGATAKLESAGSISAAMTLSGTLSMVDDATGTLTLSGNLAGGGAIALDVNASGATKTADLFIVTGDVTGTTTIDFEDIGDVGVGEVKVLEIGGAGGASNFESVRATFRFEAGTGSGRGSLFANLVQSYADNCNETSAGSGVFQCGKITEYPQDLNASGTTPLSVYVGWNANFETTESLALKLTSNSGISLTQSGTGEFKARDRAIEAINSGGSISINVAGTVSQTSTSHYKVALHAENKGTATADLTISTGDAVGGQNAISAKNEGTGAIDITVTGSATARSGYSQSNHAAILARNTARGAGIAITFKKKPGAADDAVSVAGGRHGIMAYNEGTGPTSITVAGEWSGPNGSEAVYVKAAATSGDVTISLNDRLHFAGGIDVIHQGSGTVSITVGEMRGSEPYNGRYSRFSFYQAPAITAKTGGAISLTVSGHLDSGGSDFSEPSILNESSAGQPVTVTLNSGAVLDGGVRDLAGNASVTVNAGATVRRTIHLADGDDWVGVAGGTVLANINLGSGADTLRVASGTASGSVDLGVGNDRIEVIGGSISGSFTAGAGTDTLRVAGGSISGTLVNWESVTVESGAHATVLGSATATTLTVSGDLDLSDGAIGDFDVSSDFVGGGTVTLDANLISGTADMVDVVGNVTGTTAIAYSIVGGWYPREVLVFQASGTVAAGALQAADSGSSIRIDQSGGVTRAYLTAALPTIEDGCNETVSGSGVFLCGGAMTTAQSLSASGSTALSVFTGSNMSVVVSTGTALQLAGSSGISLTQSGNGEIKGASAGIHAVNSGGSTLISVGGKVTATGTVYTHKAIYAKNQGAATGDLTISAGDVTGAGYGIRAYNQGTGAIDITVTGSVTTALGESGYNSAVFASNTSRGAGISITLKKKAGAPDDALAAQVERKGIYLKNYGTGPTSVVVEGEIGSTGIGPGDANVVLIEAAATSGDVTVSLRDQAKLRKGVSVSHAGTGDVSITVADLIGTQTQGAVSRFDGSGIYAKTGGDVSITVSGQVDGSGGSYASIQTKSAASKPVTILLNSGAMIKSGIIDEAGNASVTVAAGASVLGSSDLGAGADWIGVAGGTVSGTVSLGAGADTLLVTSGSASGSIDFGAGDDRVDVAGRIVSGTLAAGSGADTLIVRNGGSVGGVSAASASGWESITVESGGAATLSMAAGTAAMMEMALSGTLNVADGAHTTFDISGGFAGGGLLVIDVNFVGGSGDKIDVAGAITGTTRIQVNPSGGVTESRYAFAVAGTSQTGAFTLQDSVSYTLEYDSATRTHFLKQRPFTPCAETSAGSGVFICSGDDDGRKARTLTFSASGSTALSVRLNSETEIDAFGTAFDLTQTGGTGGITFTQSATGQPVTGSNDGIVANNAGGGAVSISVNGKVTGADGDGISASDGVGGGGVTITAASVAGSDKGIAAFGSGTGAVAVSATGLVTGTGAGGIGVDAAAGATAGTLTVSVATVTGSAVGVRAVGRGANDVGVSASALVEATGSSDGVGIDALTTSAGDLSITAAAVTGGAIGIKAVGSGSGAISVKASGAVTGTGTAGIQLIGGASATNAAIDAAAVAGKSGIDARHGGVGRLDVKATGDVSGTGAGGMGIYGLVSNTSGGNLTITAAAVTGSAVGIRAVASGAGSISVKAGGAVAGTGTAGVQLVGGASVINAAIDAAAVAGKSGIDARHGGIGRLDVKATGAVRGTGAGGMGIHGLVSNTSGGNLTITAAAVTGSAVGIRAVGSGTGAVSVDADDTVSATGAGGTGIYGLVSNTRGGNLTIAAASVTGGAAGIRAVGSGIGAVSVDADGAVSGAGAGGTGIYGLVSNTTGSGNLTIAAATVTGSAVGIRAVGSGTGAVSVDADGAVRGTGANGTGIYGLVSNANGGNLTITAAEVTGSGIGIKAVGSGAGAVRVSATGQVTGTSIGISATNGTGGSGITISVAGVSEGGSGGNFSRGRDGIKAVNHGAGAVNITATGQVRGWVAIAAENGARGSGITVTAAELRAIEFGIKAIGSGSGAVTIRTTGRVEAGGSGGGVQGKVVYAKTGTSGGAISVTTTGSVDGGHFGIDVNGSGQAPITVSAGGSLVRGANQAAIRVVGGPRTTDVTISTNATRKIGNSVIEARHAGTGKLDILVSGTAQVTDSSSQGRGGDAIYGLVSNTNGGALTITAAQVDANLGKAGIKAVSSGSGAVSVSASGHVRGGHSAAGAEAIGIDVLVSGNGNLTITAARVDAHSIGIRAVSSGAGTISVKATGTVTGNNVAGVYAKGGTATGAMAIDVATVTGSTGIKVAASGAAGVEITPSGSVVGTGSDGIYVDHNGSGATTITVTTAVTGGAGSNNAAIRTAAQPGRSVTVLLNSGASVGTTATNAIIGGAGNSAVTVNSGAAVSGKIAMGGGTDTLTLSAGFSDITGMDGGAGSGDTLTFAVSGRLNQSVLADGLKDWESIVVGTGTTLSVTGSSTSTGTLVAGTPSILTVQGTLNLDDEVQDNSGNMATFNVAGDFVGGGMIVLNAQFSGADAAADKLVIGGDVTGATRIRVDKIGAGTRNEKVMFADVGGSVPEEPFVKVGKFKITSDQDDGRTRFFIEEFVAGCEPLDGNRTSGIYTCYGGQVTQTVTLTANSSRGLRVTVEEEAGFNVASGRGLSMTSSGAGGIVLTPKNPGVDSAAVSAAQEAIHATNTNGGGIDIHLTGTVTSTSGTAIRVENDQSGAGVQVTATKDVSGASNGIWVKNLGSGEVQITADGVAGASGYGIYARGDGSAMDIQVDGRVTGGTGGGNGHAAIHTKTGQGGKATIKVRRGSVVGRAGGVAILSDSGQASVVAQGKILGTVNLGAGDDEFVFAGGDLGSATVTGGAGVDTLGFEDVTVTVSGGDITINRGNLNANSLNRFERVSLRSGATVSGAASFGAGDDTLILAGGRFDSSSTEIDGGSGADELVFGADVDDFNARRLTSWESVTVGTGSSVSFLSGQTLNTDLLTLPRGSVLDVSAQNSQGGLALGGDFAGGGILSVSVNFETGRADTLSIGGSATGATTVRITQDSLTKAAALTSIPRGGSIEIVSVRGTVTEGAFALAQGVEPISVGSSRFNLSFDAAGRRFVLSRLDINAVGCAKPSSGSAFAFECRGNIESPQALRVQSREDLTVGAPADLNIRTSSGTALTLRQHGAGGVAFTQAARGGPISGSESGIRIRNSEGGRVRISTTGKVTGLGTGTAHAGIAVTSEGDDVSITAAEVVGARDGVRVAHTGVGDADVTVGSVTGSGGAGVDVSNSASGNDISVQAASARGGSVGVRAVGRGYGAVSVSVSELAVAASGHGIHVSNSASGSGLSVSAGSVSGGGSGILAVGEGRGALSVSASGAVTGVSGQGIDVVGGSRGRGLAISAAAVSGGDSGVRAVGRGRGGVSVSASAGVFGGTGDGIFAQNSERGDGISILAASATGGAHGIRAIGMGSGAVSISATGKVEGRSRSGIHAEVAAGGGSLSIEAAAVSGAGRTGAGVFARNSGAGALSISTSGSVTGADGASGIHAVGGAGGVTVRAASASGEASGVRAEASGGGALDVAVSGPVAGLGTDAQDAGIRATARGGSLSVAVGGSVTGGNDGVAVRNEAAGSLRVAVASGASVSGGQAGIRVSGAMDGAAEISAAGRVSGDAAGVHVRGSGSGPISIVASAAISGGVGIDADATGPVSVSLRSGAAVSGADGVAIRDGGSDMTVTLETGASISGRISLGKGDDELNLAGGSYGAALLDGGEGRDTIRIGGEWSTEGFERLMERIENWDELGINAAGEVSLLGAYRNLNMHLDLGDGGRLSLKDGKANDSLTVAGDFQGGGSIAIDADLAANLADTLTIHGAATGGATAVALNDVTPDDAKPSGDGILVITVRDGAADDAFSLEGSDAVAGAFTYALTPRETGDGKEFHLGVGDRVSDTGAAFRAAAPALMGGFAKASTLATRNAARSGSAPGGVGQTAQAHSRSGADASEGVWLRFFSDTLESEDGGDGGQFKIDSRGFQAGWDLFAPETGRGDWVLGVMAQQGSTSGESTGVGGTGRIEAEGFGFGIAATWYGLNGTYLDAQSMFSSIETDFSSDTGGALASGSESSAGLVSLEVGRRFGSGRTLTVVPRGQVSWSEADGGSFTTGDGIEVELGSDTSLVGRLGMAIEMAMGNAVVRASGSYAREMSDAHDLVIDGTRIQGDFHETWMEFGFGVSVQASEQAVLFLDGTHRASSDADSTSGGGSGSVSGSSISGGLRWNW